MIATPVFLDANVALGAILEITMVDIVFYTQKKGQKKCQNFLIQAET